MEVEVRGLEEAVLEVVQVEAYALLVKLRLRVAHGEVQPSRTSDLHVGQLAYGLNEQLLLLYIIASPGIAATLEGIEERIAAQVLLKVAHLIVADGIDMRNGQLALREVARQGDEGVVLLLRGTDAAYHALALLTCETVVLPVAARTRKLLCQRRLLPAPTDV